MQYDVLQNKVKRAIARLYRAEYLYGSRQYGESVYAFGDTELTVVKERTFYSETTTYTLSSSEFIIEYVSGMREPTNGRQGYTPWEKFEDISSLGDLDALDRMLIWLRLAYSEE